MGNKNRRRPEVVRSRAVGYRRPVMAGVRFRNVTKTYGRGTPALRDITLDVADGEFVVLVGPSGCGKSTLLRILAGLEDASAGDVWIGDRRVNDLSPKDRDVAMVFQNYALYPHMTAHDNIAFALKVRRRAKEKVTARVRAVADLLGITPLLEKIPRELSGGERQRVALGRAIVRQPTVFLLDEPLSNLDARLRAGMRVEITALHRRLGTTTIYVTHDQVEAMTMGQRIVVLAEGRLMQAGAPLAVYEQPANRFVAGFIGSPPMNFLVAEVDSEGARHLRIGELYFPLSAARRRTLAPYAGQGVALGIRAEHLSLEAEFGLAARVTLLERTGAETLVHTVVNQAPVVMRLKDAGSIERTQKIRMGFDLERARFFDLRTGGRITDVD